MLQKRLLRKRLRLIPFRSNMCCKESWHPCNSSWAHFNLIWLVLGLTYWNRNLFTQVNQAILNILECFLRNGDDWLSWTWIAIRFVQLLTLMTWFNRFTCQLQLFRSWFFFKVFELLSWNTVIDELIPSTIKVIRRTLPLGKSFLKLVRKLLLE
jgi:hypothetical protein